MYTATISKADPTNGIQVVYTLENNSLSELIEHVQFITTGQSAAPLE